MRIARCIVALLVVLASVPSAVQESSVNAAPHVTFDQILDLYVRDGMVYYRALKIERAKLDGYVNSLAGASVEPLSPDERLAFWLNAYNALVLRTVIDHYPIQQRTSDYPPRSIRQIPGAFERLSHHVAGRAVTLDQIEQTVLPTFHDPRVYLALGRGSIGGGRLRSEAFVPARLDTQLIEVADECASRPQCLRLDRLNNKVEASAIFSWRREDFVAEYATVASSAFANRSPVERAILTFVSPKLLTTEREFLAKNEFHLVYSQFDWTLNDLTGRGGR